MFGNLALKQRFLFFGRNSGIHGLNHLFKKNAAFLARLFWLVIVSASAGCLYLLLVPMLQLDAGITFTPDTLYLEWNTVFPAVTICEETNTRVAQRKLAELYPDLVQDLTYDHRRYLADLLYGRGVCPQAACAQCGVLVPCDVQWREIMKNVHKKCDELLVDCSLNGVKFSCCEFFRAVDSEHGPCFSFNTMQNKDYVKQPLLTVNRSTGPAALAFRLLSEADISIHSPEELSTDSLTGGNKFRINANLEPNVDVLFSVAEMYNDPQLSTLGIMERNCRFLHELPDEMFHNYPVYSYGACKLARSTLTSFQHCGCVWPIRDLSYQKYYCNYTGLNCLGKHEAQKKVGLEKDVEKNCLPSCVESEIIKIHDSRPSLTEAAAKGTLVTITMAQLPSVRYQRNLMRTNLDLVVTVGGLAGLFFSASVLTFLEMFYLFLRKP